MSSRRNPIYYTLKPLYYFFPFSTTAASVRSKDLLATSVWYRFYLASIVTISTVLLFYVVWNQATITVSPFNITSLYVYYWIVQFFFIVCPLTSAKKMRTQKILRALEELDLKIKYGDSVGVEKNRRTVVAYTVAAIIYHVVIHVFIVIILTISGADTFVLTLTYWFKMLEIGIDLELLYLGSIVLLLSHRCEYFISHLKDLLEKRVGGTDLNLLLCHRQLHYVLKKINKAFRVRITVIIYFVTMLSLRNLVLVLWLFSAKLLIYSTLLLVCRYLLLLAVLGAIGQRVASTFDRLHLQVTDIRISSPINSELYRRGVAMCGEGAVQGGRLCGEGVGQGGRLCGEGAVQGGRLNGCGLVVDARLPLRVLSAIGTVLVFIFSIKIDMRSI